MTTEAGAVTSNETLASWIPGIRSIEELLDLGNAEKCPPAADGHPGHVRVAYEARQTVEWSGEKADRAGRTFEEAFALQNLAWCQNDAQADLGLRVSGASAMTLDGLHERICQRVKTFDKTDFALALITKDPQEWSGPRYIIDGLEWLRDEVTVETSDVAPLAVIEAEVGK
jgi:hypothetical protein